MTTPRIHSLVSFAGILTVAFALGGCATGQPRVATNATVTSAEQQPAVIHFENQAHDYVRVYLVGVRNQWLLGRLEAGQRSTLRIPEEALGDDSRAMWLAVVEGGRASGRVAADPRAVSTTPEHVSRIVSDRWTFTSTAATGQLTSLRLGRDAGVQR